MNNHKQSEFDIHLDARETTPLYRQIADQIRKAIAGSQLKPGDRLPTVRRLAADLKVNPGTIVRAFLELEQDRVIISRRGAGTTVLNPANDPGARQRRERQLASIMSSNMVELLSMGYSMEEIIASFHLHLARWNEKREQEVNEPAFEPSEPDSSNRLVIAGSHDLALDMLVKQVQQSTPELKIEVSNIGSLGGLIALQEGKADIAGTHLFDAESGTYNVPYIHKVLPGKKILLVHLAYRIQGLIVQKGNPSNIMSLRDLARPGITFVNRQSGAGTRVLLDLELEKLSVPSKSVRGYDHEVATHLAVASAVASRQADAGLGIQAVAVAYNLDFVPLFRERYDLAIPVEKYESELLAPLLTLIQTREFRESVTSIGGYDAAEMGSITFC